MERSHRFWNSLPEVKAKQIEEKNKQEAEQRRRLVRDIEDERRRVMTKRNISNR